jgi:hypothetical protein
VAVAGGPGFGGGIFVVHGISSRTSSASSWAAGARSVDRRVAASAVPTCATTWKSRSKRPIPARPRRSGCRPRLPAILLRQRCQAWHPAEDLRHLWRCRTGSRLIRDSSLSSAPARPATGRGNVIDRPLRKCAGQGRVTEERTLSVNIPEGIEDGTRIRLSGEGEAGMRGGHPATSTSSCRSSRTSFPARRRRPVLPRADLDDHGGAGRQVRSHRPLTARGPG